MKILGIDPGSAVAGFACIASKSEQGWLPRDFHVIDIGVIKFHRSVSHAMRLSQLHTGMLSLIDELQPDLCVIERAFCGINAASALKLGEARGALIAAILSRGVHFSELSPRQAKKMITGQGHASKQQVADTLRTLFNRETVGLPLDATDALAIALAGVLRRGPALSSVFAQQQGPPEPRR